MTTKKTGGTITGILALTLEAQSALQVNQPVMVTGDYSCDLADGSKPVIGTVSVRNVGRQALTGVYPVALVPGDVTVEARGWFVRTVAVKDATAITAGTKVGIGASNKIEPSGAGVADCGVALTGCTSGTGKTIDVLFD